MGFRINPYQQGTSVFSMSSSEFFQLFHLGFKSFGISVSHPAFLLHNSCSIDGFTIPSGSNMELTQLKSTLFVHGNVFKTALTLSKLDFVSQMIPNAFWVKSSLKSRSTILGDILLVGKDLKIKLLFDIHLVE